MIKRRNSKAKQHHSIEYESFLSQLKNAIRFIGKFLLNSIRLSNINSENKRTPELKSWLEYFDVIWIYKNQNFNKGIDAKAVVYELSNVSYKYFHGAKRTQRVFKSSKSTLYPSYK